MKKTPIMFDNRNTKKKRIEFDDSIKNIDAVVGELWRYYEGVNIGHEQSK